MLLDITEPGALAAGAKGYRTLRRVRLLFDHLAEGLGRYVGAG